MGRYHSGITTVRVEDSAGVGITVGPGEGNFQGDGLEYNNKERVQKFDRGGHDGWVETQDKTQACSITVDVENKTITDALADRLYDFFVLGKLSGVALTSVSSDTWAWKTIVTMNDGATTSVITYPECVGGAAFAEGAEGHTLALNWINAVAPVVS